MSVYLPRDKTGKPKTRVYQYDFRIKPKGAKESQRFFGSTGQATVRSAERVEARLKELAKLGQLSHAMTVAGACERYWEQKMQHTRSAKDQATNLEVISTYLGAETLVIDITPEIIAEAAARRAQARVRKYNRRTGQVEVTEHKTSLATVNRQLIQPLRRFLKYCRKPLGVPIDLTDFNWSELRYEEAEERNREIAPGDEIRYWQTLREDYHPIVEMYLISGSRSDWVELTRDKVDINAGTVRVPSRKKKPGEITVRLTPAELEIISAEMAKAPLCRYVFTYELQRGEAKGERRAITATGLRRAHSSACAAAGIEDFRIHDFRHTMASRLMRSSRNPKLVQRNLDHASISSTARYMHVMEDEVLEARGKVTTYRSSPGVVSLPSKIASNNK